ncbi:MAG: hypothetical protein LBS35_07390 [Synergistaceae bacterium]|jgi:hypothetical protein|nr:hypothetical protein [Synergistaceae bacterium]
MTITITKGKLIRWIIAAVILFCGAVEADDAPKVILNIARHREFMAEFTGYDDYSLIDVYQWRSGFFGVVMLCPAGFHETFVFDCRDGKREVIYRDVYIPRKEKREEFRRESILVADAVRLAKTALTKGEAK